MTTPSQTTSWAAQDRGPCLGALIDRFAQHCHVLDIDAESWRNKKDPLKRDGKSKPTKQD